MVGKKKAGNKGEWSEIYVLFRLAADGRVYAADEDLKKIDTQYFPIIHLLKTEVNTYCENITDDKKGIYFVLLRDGTSLEDVKADVKAIQIFRNGKEEGMYSVEKIRGEANRVYTAITQDTKGNIEISETQAFLESIGIENISAKSNKKADLHLKVQDIHTGYTPTIGFSVKSFLGKSPTLFNSSLHTNFKFIFSKKEKLNIVKERGGYDAETKVRSVIKHLILNKESEGYQLRYEKMQSDTFSDNLVLIDSLMDQILAHALIYYYRDGIKSCEEIVRKLERENPVGFNKVAAYGYKLRKFLATVALGLRPGDKNWNGDEEANGGYIIVTKEGDVLAYHIYNRVAFEKYLLRNTRLDTPSRTKHKHGEIYQEGDSFYIDLNLQIRFK